MKIEITCEDLSKGRTYPYIGKYNSGIDHHSVLFLSDSCGFVVKEGRADGFQPGYMSEGWVEACFTPIAYPPFDLSFSV